MRVPLLAGKGSGEAAAADRHCAGSWWPAVAAPALRQGQGGVSVACALVGEVHAPLPRSAVPPLLHPVSCAVCFEESPLAPSPASPFSLFPGKFAPLIELTTLLVSFPGRCCLGKRERKGEKKSRGSQGHSCSADAAVWRTRGHTAELLVSSVAEIVGRRR